LFLGVAFVYLFVSFFGMSWLTAVQYY